LQQAGKDLVSLDIHYILDGHVAVTVVLLEGCGIADDGVPDLLAYIDDKLLPEVSLEEDTLVFSVVRATTVDNYVREQKSLK